MDECMDGWMDEYVEWVDYFVEWMDERWEDGLKDNLVIND